MLVIAASVASRFKALSFGAEPPTPLYLMSSMARSSAGNTPPRPDNGLFFEATPWVIEFGTGSKSPTPNTVRVASIGSGDDAGWGGRNSDPHGVPKLWQCWFDRLDNWTIDLYTWALVPVLIMFSIAFFRPHWVIRRIPERVLRTAALITLILLLSTLGADLLNTGNLVGRRWVEISGDRVWCIYPVDNAGSLNTYQRDWRNLWIGATSGQYLTLITFSPRTLAVLMAVFGFTLWLIDSAARHRRTVQSPPTCRRCGYDRTGLAPQTPCPECGHAPKPNTT